MNVVLQVRQDGKVVIMCKLRYGEKIQEKKITQGGKNGKKRKGKKC